MRYRLVELLRCPTCRAELDVVRAETRSVPASATRFTCARSCALEGRRTLPPPSRCDECAGLDIVDGVLACRSCHAEFPIVGAVPWLHESRTAGVSRLAADTAALYGHVWTTLTTEAPSGSTHVDLMEATLAEPIVRGRLGLDAGSGNGYDTALMARRHPDVEIISVDLSEGVYQTRRRTEGLPNVHVVRASVLALPLADEICDFGYSFGVLHHTPDPARGLGEVVRVLKPGATVFLYLYEDHADNPWKAWPLRAVTAARRVTTRLGPRALSAMCYALSPIVVLAFSLPAHLMRRFRRTRRLAERMPFNFGTTPFSVHGDLVDRLGAPIEFRYSRESLTSLLEAFALTGIRITKFVTLAGWVAAAAKRAKRSVTIGA